MQRRTASILLLAAGLAVAVAVLRPWDADVAPPAPPGAPPEDGGAPIANSRPQPPAPRPQEGRQDPTALPADAPRVLLEVVARERYEPPSPLRVHARRAGDGHEYAASVLAGAGAGFDAKPHAAGAAMALVEHEQGLVLRQVALAATDATTIELGAPLLVRGKVAGTAGEPIAGASVWLGELLPDGGRREATTGADGLFELPALAGSGVPFAVRAPGHAAVWRPIVVGDPPPVADAVLERGCELTVQLAGTAVAMEQARAFVVPRAAVGTGLAQWPFFVQALDGGAALDASGRATIAGLPARGEVGIVIRHPRAALAAASEVALKGERVRTTLPIVFAAATWNGTVVDEQGAPLPGVAVFARTGGGSLASATSQRLLPPHLDLRGTFAGWTGDDGAFTVGAAGAAGAVLSLRAPGRAGRDVSAAELAGAAPLVLPAWRGGDAELRVLPPRAGTAWSAETSVGGGVRVALAADAPWRVALPHAGRFDVVLTTFVGGEERGRARHDGVHATGVIELPAPAPR